MLLRSTARRDENLVGEFANPRIAEPSEADSRLHKDLLANYCDIFATCCRVGLQSGLAGRKVDMGWGALVDTRG